MTTTNTNTAAPAGRVIRFVLNGKTYRVRWDSEFVLDTIQRESDGEFLTVKNRDALRIVNNEAKLLRGVLPAGFEYAPKER